MSQDKENQDNNEHDELKNSRQDKPVSGEPPHAKPDTPHLLNELARKNAAPSPRSRKTSSFPVALLFVFVIAVTAGGGWFGYQQWQAQSAYQQTLDTIREDNQRLQQQLLEAESNMRAELQDQVSRMQASRDALNVALDELGRFEQSGEQRLNRFEQQVSRDMQDVNTVVSALQRQLGNLQQRDTRWLNAEANYLMRLAQRKLATESDVSSALLLLRTVRDLLAEQNSVLATTARQAVADDIQSLQAVQLPDRVALATQISQLANEIDQLTLAGLRQDTYQENIQAGWQQTREEGWFAAGLNLLRTIFVWREWDDSPAEMLPPQQEVLLKHHLQLQLEQARLALIQGDQALYSHVLMQSGELLQTYFAQDTDRVRTVVDAIDRLAASDVAVELPDLSTSAGLVNQLATSSGSPDL